MENCTIIKDFIPKDKEKFKILSNKFKKLINEGVAKNNLERISIKRKTFRSKNGLPIKFIQEIYPDKTITILQTISPIDNLKN